MVWPEDLYWKKARIGTEGSDKLVQKDREAAEALLHYIIINYLEWLK